MSLLGENGVLTRRENGFLTRRQNGVPTSREKVFYTGRELVSLQGDKGVRTRRECVLTRKENGVLLGKNGVPIIREWCPCYEREIRPTWERRCLY